MEVIHFFLVDKDKLLVVVAEFKFLISSIYTQRTLLLQVNVIQQF